LSNGLEVSAAPVAEDSLTSMDLLRCLVADACDLGVGGWLPCVPLKLGVRVGDTTGNASAVATVNSFADSLVGGGCADMAGREINSAVGVGCAEAGLVFAGDI
jgi:hypothetical protein